MGFIYQATNTESGNTYIGKTKNPIRARIADHTRQSAKGSKTYFHTAIRKYGIDKFKFTILEHVVDDLLNTREKFYIADSKPKYNMTVGGDGGTTTIKTFPISDGKIQLRIPVGQEIPQGFRRGFTDEHKANMKLNAIYSRKSMSPETKAKISESRKGQTPSEEHRKKLSEANIRRWAK